MLLNLVFLKPSTSFQLLTSSATNNTLEFSLTPSSHLATPTQRGPAHFSGSGIVSPGRNPGQGSGYSQPGSSPYHPGGRISRTRSNGSGANGADARSRNGSQKSDGKSKV